MQGRKLDKRKRAYAFGRRLKEEKGKVKGKRTDGHHL